jgi:hypothetical protein
LDLANRSLSLAFPGLDLGLDFKVKDLADVLFIATPLISAIVGRIIDNRRTTTFWHRAI